MSYLQSEAFIAFRCRDFSLLSLNQLCLVLAVVMQEVAIGFALYQITQDPLSLGFIAVVELLPFIGLSFFGGHWADRYNRQKLLQWSFSLSSGIPLLMIVVFYIFQTKQIEQNTLLCLVYFLIFCLGILRGIYSPAFNSIRPFLISRQAENNASMWTTSIWQFGAIAAPLCAGLLLSHVGLVATLGVIFMLSCIGSLAVWQLSPRSFPISIHGQVLQSLKHTFRFMLQQRVLFWSMLLDLVTALFCSVIVLLPIVAHDVLHLGAEALSLLRATPAIGTALMMGVLLHFSPSQKAWRNMLLASIGIAITTCTFALSTSLWLSIALLILIGALDSISMVIRQSLLQQLPPQDLHGRVAALNGIWVTTGNHLGALNSSMASRYFTITPAILIGGSLCLSICLFSFFRNRDLLKTPSSYEKYKYL
ncbi:MFS transporter [Acinetobacter towneri]|uniref:MFS transporter n=1 Tax=Acinetobacter towneri TaxID=202956 RepID=UPI001F309DDA|nr:MFS transporter [Acinetobacter towneri]UIP24121.1 MFS transporter [Acinetobacter towneri]